MKIVINHCCGGFWISPAAMKRIAELKGHDIYCYRTIEYGNGTDKPSIYERVPFDRPDNPYISTNDFSKDFGNKTTNLDWKFKFSPCNFERTDQQLVQVVEEMGEQASDIGSFLVVIEIPNDIEYCIERSEEGIETIKELPRESLRIWGSKKYPMSKRDQIEAFGKPLAEAEIQVHVSTEVVDEAVWGRKRNVGYTMIYV